MIIGIDFDNTIVSYDSVIYQTALEKKLISESTDKNKQSVKKEIIKNFSENEWTFLQGYIYGKAMINAKMFDGVERFLKEMLTNGHKLYIISHKTKFPYMGPKYDLHKSATNWIKENITSKNLITNYFFLETKKEKIEKINSLKCDYFIDDLEEILLDSNLKKDINKILFTHNKSEKEFTQFIQASSWHEIREFFYGST